MISVRKLALLILLLMAAVAVPAFAQGPLHKQINFTINVPFELKKANLVLPPGNYVLYQIEANNPNLFALFREDMTHSPIAMIATARVEYSARRVPGKTRLLMDVNESSPLNNPVIEGWTIPGEDGWEMIAAVTGHGEGLSSKYQAKR